METLVRPAPRPQATRPPNAALTLGALGVVFGDIGTSLVQPTSQAVFGVVSLVFWSITLIVSVKYVTFVLRADNDGEGGIVALAARVRRTAVAAGRSSTSLVAPGVFGAARFGFQEEADIPAALPLAAEKGLECDIDLGRPTYFLSRATIRVTDTPGMNPWRKRLFVAIWRNSANPVEWFHLPDRRTITLGWQVPL